MYLGLINDQCKPLFLGLAQELAMADNVVESVEKELLSQYAFEMGIDAVMPNKDLPSLLDEICQASNDQEKRIIAFELAGLAGADHVYAPEEQKIMEEIARRFAISPADMLHLRSMIIQYYDFLKNAHNFIFG